MPPAPGTRSQLNLPAFTQAITTFEPWAANQAKQARYSMGLVCSASIHDTPATSELALPVEAEVSCLL